MGTHLHKYKFKSEAANGHKHNVYGRTDYMIGINAFHFHHFIDVSSYDGHTHYYSGITGFPIKTEFGHIHKIEGILEFNIYHEHKFSNYTFEDIQYISKPKTREAIV